MISGNERLGELIAIPSVSGSEQAIAAYVADRCHTQGYAVTEMADSVVAHIPGSDSSKAFILNGHYDTVPPTDQWAQDPFTLRVNPDDEDQLIGLGTTDMKAGIDTMLAIGEQAREQRPPCDLWLVFASNEETTGSGSAAVATWMSAEVTERYHTIGGLILEPTDAAFVGVGHRGDTVWNITARGPGGHASQHFNTEPPPIEKIARLIAALPGLRQQWAADYANAILGTPSINPTVVRAGATENVVPNEARALLNLRITPELLPFLPDIRATMEAAHDVTIQQSWEPRPSLCPPNAHIYKTMRAVLPDVPFQSFPGATDQIYFHEHGIPMAIYGPGDPAAMHQPDETIRRSAIARSRKAIERILAHY